MTSELTSEDTREPHTGDAQESTPASTENVTAAESGSLQDLCDRVSTRVPAAAIDELWLFPARKSGAGESTLFVISAYDSDASRRRVLTARFGITRDAKGGAVVEEIFEEHGSAPDDRVIRVIDGVIRRLGDELSVTRHVPIGGTVAAWREFRSEPGGQPQG